MVLDVISFFIRLILKIDYDLLVCINLGIEALFSAVFGLFFVGRALIKALKPPCGSIVLVLITPDVKMVPDWFIRGTK